MEKLSIMVPLDLERIKEIERRVEAGEYETVRSLEYKSPFLDSLYHVRHAVQLVAERRIDVGDYQGALNIAKNMRFNHINLLRRSMQQESERLVDAGECNYAINVADEMGFDLAIMAEGICWACGGDLADGGHYPDICLRRECDEAYRERIGRRLKYGMPRSARRKIILRVRRIDEALLKQYVQEVVDRLHAVGDIKSSIFARNLADKSGYTLRWGKKSASLQAPRYHEEP
ncbi:hypothetical protein [Thioalkalivibrio sp. HK1]|uniref:hypothetical protein n=1 Tax=Thioalkalivibrio sp. HK1 TaxID=1469245 RepID=UPI0012DF8A4B|nr:hypothetical protein [Thioalkalivibrio sp. HK1]